MNIDNIDNNNINASKIANYYQQIKKREEKSDKKVQNDKMQISDKAKEMIKAKKELENQPEVRAEKVTSIKEKIAEGTYQVDSKKIAAKILKDLE